MKVRVVGLFFKKADLFAEAPQPLLFGEIRVAASEVHLVDDRKHRDFEGNRVQPRPRDADVDPAGEFVRGTDVDVLALQVKEAQKLDVVRLHEAQRRQVRKLLVGEVDRREVVDLGRDLVDHRTKVDAGRTALEAVLDLGGRELVQHALLHREFVEVRVEERLNDHESLSSKVSGRPCAPTS